MFEIVLSADFMPSAAARRSLLTGGDGAPINGYGRRRISNAGGGSVMQVPIAVMPIKSTFI